jgi:hypothetical protein
MSSFKRATSTRVGIVRELYGLVEPRPYSRFTQRTNEILANDHWTIRALRWGDSNVDEYGNPLKNASLKTNIEREELTNIDGDIRP